MTDPTIQQALAHVECGVSGIHDAAVLRAALGLTAPEQLFALVAPYYQQARETVQRLRKDGFVSADLALSVLAAFRAGVMEGLSDGS